MRQVPDTKNFQNRLAVAALILGIVCVMVLLAKFSVDIGDARKAENFAREGWLAGSFENLKESFGNRRLVP